MEDIRNREHLATNPEPQRLPDRLEAAEVQDPTLGDHNPLFAQLRWPERAYMDILKNSTRTDPTLRDGRTLTGR